MKSLSKKKVKLPRNFGKMRGEKSCRCETIKGIGKAHTFNCVFRKKKVVKRGRPKQQFTPAISLWKEDGEYSPPSIISAVEFRREQYGWTKTEMARHLGIGRGHYTEFIQGKRTLSYRTICRAYNIGVPASVLLQRPSDLPKKRRAV